MWIVIILTVWREETSWTPTLKGEGNIKVELKDGVITKHCSKTNELTIGNVANYGNPMYTRVHDPGGGV